MACCAPMSRRRQHGRRGRWFHRWHHPRRHLVHLPKPQCCTAGGSCRHRSSQIFTSLFCSNVSSISCDPAGYPHAGNRRAAPDPNGRLKSVSQVALHPIGQHPRRGPLVAQMARLPPNPIGANMSGPASNADPPIRSEFPDLVTLQRSCIPEAAEYLRSSHGCRWSKRCCPVAVMDEVELAGVGSRLPPGEQQLAVG